MWGQVTATCAPSAAAARYATLVRVRARRVDAAAFAASAREDAARLAAGLGAVLALHTPDAQQRCRACAVDARLVDWPCRTRLAAEDGLRQGWPAPDPTDPPGAPGPYEGFALALLATHIILPAVAGRPAYCRACGRPADACPAWALAEGFLGITWANPGEIPGYEAATHAG